ncbi:uncharacterized protein L201_006882 [Kwoniella dendrophila CBS 6074]|uniref:Dilute domain-containing protein n=1 Tax=Kwoniella dendrophila CBS 6074 TaxID=1295534 RepID=A0AAX4K2T5_9TREE
MIPPSVKPNAIRRPSFPPPINPNSPSIDSQIAFSPNPLHNPQLSHVLVPESPLIDLTMSSPDHRGLQVETASITSSTTGNGITSGQYHGSSSLGESSRRGLHRSGSYKRVPEPRFLADPSPANILPLLDAQKSKSNNNDDDGDIGRELRLGLILRRSIKWAVERCDTDLIGWLVGLEGKWADILDTQAQQLEDEEGWGLVGMAVQASCGRQDKEESVRVIVGRWGLEVGQRGGKDRTGWTPLHLAALISTPPLISFLLSRGSSPHALTNRGLTPLDLVVGLPDKEDVALFLEHATCYGGESSTTPQTATTLIPHFPPARQSMLERRRRQATVKMEAIEREERRYQIELERETWLRERARMVDVDPELLIKPLPTKAEIKAESDDRDSGLGWMGYEIDLEAERQNDDESDNGFEEDDFDISQLDLNSNMLVFSLTHLPAIFDILITDYQPVCQPLQKRSLPANALYLYARFALYKCDETWLEDLIDGIVDRIEDGVRNNVDNLAYLAFWAYNTAVLLHLIRADPPLRIACEELDVLGMMEELINAIHVFVIRIAEQRIDIYLDAAILDYETLEDFNDIRFEGEWSIFRSFAPKKKRETPRAASIFASSPGDSPASSSVYGTPQRTPNRHQSMSDLRLGVGTPRSISHESNISGTSAQSHTPTVEIEINPSRITDILSGVLLILQLYEVNPAIVVQAFSQVYFWISCELFNRILAQKKYLCRTKALQIKMNISVLDDWVRANGLPAQTATKHLEPVSQLLQWLQCLSQIKEFDTLIGTLQNMKAVNPLQMRRAVKDYKYEVNEGKMNEECGQYLVQLQKDWEKRRVQYSVQEAERRRSLGSLSSDNSSHGHGEPPLSSNISLQGAVDDSTPIDALFDGTVALGEFIPQSAPECLGELLDSRFMLPFLLPNDNSYLIASPPKDAAYRNLLPASPFISDGSKQSTILSRPPSRASFSSSRPMGYTLPKQNRLRELPMNFFSWLKEKETNQRLNRDAWEFKQKRLVPSTIDNALDGEYDNYLPPRRIERNHSYRDNRDKEKSPTPTPTRPVVSDVDTIKANRLKNHGGLLPSLTENADQDKTLINGLPNFSHSHPNEFGIKQEGLPTPSKGLRSSKSIEQLRESSKSLMTNSTDTKETLSNTHKRTESFELKLRMQQRNSSYSYPSSPSTIMSPTLEQHASLLKSPTLSQFSNNSNDGTGNGSGGSGGKKKWWKLGKKLSSINLKDEFNEFKDSFSDRDSINSRRKLREGSEDTISPNPGNGWYDLQEYQNKHNNHHEEDDVYGQEDMKTPIRSPGSSDKKGFWS